MQSGWKLRVSGLVQGVGFRPWIWRIATGAGLRGEVLNDAQGVLIHLFCSKSRLGNFLLEMQRDPPPLARIDGIEVTRLEGRVAVAGFTIVASQGGDIRTGITPDAATCPDCLGDIADPHNRRNGYAFTNCTNCGPRLTITRAIPYDRANTTMAVFPMCPACQEEYDDPQSRRFHAQPNACPDCGPRPCLVDRTGTVIDGDPIAAAARLLELGNILAIKGLGGFQLAVDAGNDKAVASLRTRKHRPAKPLAVMVRDTAMAARLVILDDPVRAALQSWQAPIVLAPVRQGKTGLSPDVAPDQGRLGLMLPYTPLHHLLMDKVARPIVLTSGNLSQEPQQTDNAAALENLSRIADFWLLHDRGIVNRMDDSVVQVVGHSVQVLRRARGYAPAPLTLHPGFADAPPILAMGVDFKNTFCLLKDGQAIVSQHMGDMETPETQRDFHANLDLYQRVYDFSPDWVAVDLHPGYFSTRLGQEMAARADATLIRVQHHHAHIAATMAEHGFAPDAGPVLGVVLDGLGMGSDGTIWGGEFLLANFIGFDRISHLPAVALPGGEKANQQPWRNLLAHLLAAFGPEGFEGLCKTHAELDAFAALGKKPTAMLAQMIHQKVNSPLASSAGRLFDAVAAALGLCFEHLQFEGQAAMRLQTLAETVPDETGNYDALDETTASMRYLWQGILGDLACGTAPAIIAKRFHNSLSRMIGQVAGAAATTGNVDRVVLSGGVFQNGLLALEVCNRLERQGLRVLTPKMFPSNDGGIALGQASILGARKLAGC